MYTHLNHHEIGLLIHSHGGIMAITFGLLMTVASGLIRFPKGGLKIHIAVMSIAYVAMLAAFGVGVYTAYILHKLDHAHSIIGFIVVGMLLSQPLFGWLAHCRFKLIGRNALGLYHRWNGRIFITLAVINGGLGIQLTGYYTPRAWAIAYGVVAGTFTLAWYAVTLIDFLRNRRHAYNKMPRERQDSADAEQEPGAAEKETASAQMSE